jgi:hypothetical protein
MLSPELQDGDQHALSARHHSTRQSRQHTLASLSVLPFQTLHRLTHSRLNGSALGAAIRSASHRFTSTPRGFRTCSKCTTSHDSARRSAVREGRNAIRQTCAPRRRPASSGSFRGGIVRQKASWTLLIPANLSGSRCPTPRGAPASHWRSLAFQCAAHFQDWACQRQIDIKSAQTSQIRHLVPQ